MKLHEGNDVTVDVAHVKIESAPRLPDESLRKFHTAPFILFK